MTEKVFVRAIMSWKCLFLVVIMVVIVAMEMEMTTARVDEEG